MTVGEKIYKFDDNDSSPVKLYYFDIIGKGEGIRRALYHSHIPFIDVRLDRATFRKMKESGELAFGQLPVLRTADGKHLLAQSAAIYRYIGKYKARLYPESDVEAAKVDAVVDQAADLMVGVSVSTYQERFGLGFLNDEPEKVKTIRKSLNDEVLPRHLTSIERTIDPKVGPWLAGQANPTIADFSMVYALKTLASGRFEGIQNDILKPFPKVCGMVEAFDKLPVSAVDF